MTCFTFEAPILPKGFELPSSYLSVAAAGRADLAPWQLLSESMPMSLAYYGEMLIKFPELHLVPFAMISDASGLYNDGWIVLACFDGKDASGDPRVLIYDYSTPSVLPGSNISYKNFEEWLNAAGQESIRYKAEREANDQDD